MVQIEKSGAAMVHRKHEWKGLREGGEEGGCEGV